MKRSRIDTEFFVIELSDLASFQQDYLIEQFVIVGEKMIAEARRK